MTRYYFFDQTLYRDVDDTVPDEAWIDGEWKHISPSEQDYEGMREIDEADALRHQAVTQDEPAQTE